MTLKEMINSRSKRSTKIQAYRSLLPPKFIYSKDTEKDTKEIFYLLVDTPNGHSGWNWARTKPGTGTSSGSPNILGKHQLFSQAH